MQDPPHTPTNPLHVPPAGSVCFINDLPPELLSRIFEVGAADTDSEDDDDRKEYWRNLGHYARESDSDKDPDDSDEDEDTEEGDDEGSDSDDDDDSDDSDSFDFPPPWPPFQIVVSHVCRHWRHVALSTPSLWTTIVVAPEFRPPYQPVSTLLERNKGLPIDIYINREPQELDLETGCCSPSDADLKCLYDLLVPHVHRWRTIEVSVSEYQHIFSFLSAVSDPSISTAPQLTTLQLYHHEETDEPGIFGHPNMAKHFTLFGGSAPCLTSVVLWGVHVDWEQPWIASAPRLVDLELAFHAEDVRPSWGQLATILRGAPSLEKLSLRMSGPLGDPPEWFIEPTPTSTDLNLPVVLPKVTDFILAFHSQVRAIGLVRKFVLPAVKNLVLDFDSGDYTELIDVLVGPATSLSPPPSQDQPRSLLSRLEGLKLAGLPCHPESIDVLYSELRNLTSLNISLSFLHPGFLDLLGTSCTLAGRGDIWLPRMTTLYVSGTSGDVLREIVEKRRSAGVPLQSLYVEESCELDSEDVEWLRQNLETFELFEGSDDEDVADFEDLHDSDVDAWSDSG